MVKSSSRTLNRPCALRFPNWNAISRDETKIGDWAKANNVTMDKLYADDHREGGTLALGKEIRYIPRDSLNVLPECS